MARPRQAAFGLVLLASTSTASLLLPLDASRRLADNHFSRVVSRAHSTVPAPADPLPITPSYVIFTLVFNCAAHLAAAHEMAAILELPSNTLFSSGLLDNLGGLVWGVPGALAMAAIERWRCDDACSVAEEDAYNCVRCSALTNPILIGTAPLAILSSMVLADATIGERSVRVLTEVDASTETRSFDSAPVGLPSSQGLLVAGGALVSCAWAQGIMQGGVCSAFREASMRVAMAGVDCDAMVASSVGVAYAFPAFPLFAARAALEPAAVVLLTAAAATLVEMGASRALQPMARAKTEAAVAALDDAKRRARSLFALEVDAASASAAADDFAAQIEAWKRAREEATRKDLLASAGRAAVAASAFAASGGCLVAPVVASLGVAVDDLPESVPGFGGRQPPAVNPIGFILVAILWACGSAAAETLPGGLF